MSISKFSSSARFKSYWSFVNNITLVETNRFIKYPKGVVRKICRIRLGTDLVAGAALLPGDPWERRHELIFELELQRAECEFVTGVLGGSGGPPGCAFNAHRNDGPASSRGMYARGPVHDHQPERFCRSVLKSGPERTWGS